MASKALIVRLLCVADAGWVQQPKSMILQMIGMIFLYFSC